MTEAAREERTGRQARAIVVMGVAGSGKSIVGETLAKARGTDFIEGDRLHPLENIALMASGTPLDDEHRKGWLDAIGRQIVLSVDQGHGAVAACSALKRSYRDRLRGFAPDLVFLYLKVDPATARDRVAGRRNHFMPASLVESQFAALEEPAANEAALTLDGAQPVDVLVEAARNRLAASGPVQAADSPLPSA